MQLSKSQRRNIMMGLSETLIEEFEQRVPDGTKKEMNVSENETECFFSWNKEEFNCIQVRLSLFDDCVAITTWEKNLRRDVSVTTVNEGLVVFDFFENVTILFDD